MKNAFDELVSRLDTAVERIFELEDMLYQKNPQKPKTKENKNKKSNRKSNYYRTTTKGIKCVMGILKEKRETKRQ